MNPLDKKKLDIYHKFYKEMQLLDTSPEDSYIDNYIILDEPQDLTELHIIDQNAIKQQDNLHNYEKFKTHTNKLSTLYNTSKYFISASKWVSFY